MESKGDGAVAGMDWGWDEVRGQKTGESSVGVVGKKAQKREEAFKLLQARNSRSDVCSSFWGRAAGVAAAAGYGLVQ